MRTYAPMPTLAALAELLADPAVADAVTAHRRVPARAAVTADLPSWLHPAVVRAVNGRGIERLYSHQAEALDAIRAGEDPIVVTPTASGKSLCYHLPVLDAVARDPSARALYLFPTKALGQDQVAELSEQIGRAHV